MRSQVEKDKSQWTMGRCQLQGPEKCKVDRRGHSHVEFGLQRAGEVLLGFEDHAVFVHRWSRQGGHPRIWDLQDQRSEGEAEG